MGKGSERRPRAVERERFDSNWERTFGRPKCKRDRDQPRTLARQQTGTVLGAHHAGDKNHAKRS